MVAGNQGFLAIGDWIDSYRAALNELFQVDRLPSYSTIRRVLLRQDYQDYSARLTSFFGVRPKTGETIAVDGFVLRGSYLVETDNPHQEPHPAIMLVSAYLALAGLILEPYEVDSKTHEITAKPEFIKMMALQGVVFAFDALRVRRLPTEGNHTVGTGLTISTQKKPVKSSLIRKTTTLARSRATNMVC